MNIKVVSLILRGGSVLGKFLLLFLMSKALSAEEMGVYGLFAVTVGYSLYFLGIDFYTFSGREMARTSKENWLNIFLNQMTVYFFSYIVILPVLSVIFINKILPVKYIFLFYLILIFEHLSVEFFRIFIVVERYFIANIILFIRLGLWCYVLVFLYIYNILKIDLDVVFIAWLSGNIFSFILSVFFLYKLFSLNNNITEIDLSWIYKGIKIASILLIGSLFLRGIFTFDRYLIEYYLGKKSLGVYALYFGLSYSLVTIIDAVIFSFYYPRLIRTFKNDSYTSFESLIKKLTKLVLLATTVTVVIIIIFIKPLLTWTDKPFYIESIMIFYIILGSSAFFTFSHIPHYALYAMGKDKSIVISNAIGLIIFLVSGCWMIALFGLLGLSIALLISTVSLGLMKYIFYMKAHTKTNNR